MKKTSPSVYNTGNVKTSHREGRDFMRNPWAVGLIIFFSLLFLIGVNIGELDFLYNVGRTICLSCIGVG
jgi:hypothetical protein